MDRTERRAGKLQKLGLSSSMLDKYDQPGTLLPPGGTKLGDGLSNVVMTVDSIETNIPNPQNPGFKFSSAGSSISHGSKLDLSGPFTSLGFKGGEQGLNPMGVRRASSTTDPLPTIVMAISRPLEALINSPVQDLIQISRMIAALGA